MNNLCKNSQCRKPLPPGCLSTREYCNSGCRNTAYQRMKRNGGKMPIPSYVHSENFTIVQVPEPDAKDEEKRTLPRGAIKDMLVNGFCVPGTIIRAKGTLFCVRGDELTPQKLVSCKKGIVLA